jgi:N-acetyl-gamma-glutamyl-phosphate reductase
MKYKIFVDGQEGTTGLKIHERLETRDDIEILKISSEKRKDIVERRRLINMSDIVFLCLPDASSRESVSLVENNVTRIIDASTAHRTAEGWIYGLPELSQTQRQLIKTSKRVSVPGCYATGFNLAIHPLIKEGILPKDYPVTCHAVSGYSGGGKKLIEQYETTTENSANLRSPRFYSLGLSHKHIPEMQKISGLQYPPLFVPVVGNYFKGMSVSVPLLSRLLNKNIGGIEIQKLLAKYYKDEHFIKVMPYNEDSNLDNGFFGATACNDTNTLQLSVFGNSEQILLMSRLDNLGKGASGAAIQLMNIMLGIDEAYGLEEMKIGN